jgi:hypothetical protein
MASRIRLAIDMPRSAAMTRRRLCISGGKEIVVRFIASLYHLVISRVCNPEETRRAPAKAAHGEAWGRDGL